MGQVKKRDKKRDTRFYPYTRLKRGKASRFIYIILDLAIRPAVRAHPA
jgi:hypothetical protein